MHAIYRVVQKSGHQIYFCYNFSKCIPILTIIHCYNKKGITQEYKLMCATSPLICGHTTYSKRNIRPTAIINAMVLRLFRRKCGVLHLCGNNLYL